MSNQPLVYTVCVASFSECFIQDVRRKATQLLPHFTHSGTSAADVPSPHPAVGAAVKRLFNPAAQVTASPRTASASLTDQME